MADHDPLGSAAVAHHVQYGTVRSPVPQMLPRAQSLGCPIPVYANAFGARTFCRAKSLPPPTKLDTSRSSISAGEVLGRNRRSVEAFRAASVCEDAQHRFLELCNARPLSEMFVSSMIPIFAAESREEGSSVGKCCPPACSDVEDRRSPRKYEAHSTRSSSPDAKMNIDDTNDSPENTVNCCKNQRIPSPPGTIDTAGPSECQRNTTGMKPKSDITVPSTACRKKGGGLLVPTRKEDRTLGMMNTLHRAGGEELNVTKRATSSRARGVGPQNSVCGTARARVGGQSKAASNNVDTNVWKTTLSGRRSVPVLDWWRSQRLRSTPDGKTVVSVGSSRNELSPPRIMAPPHKIVRPKSAAAHAIAQKQNRPKINGDGTSDSEVPLWTKAQLECLHVAHMGTAPTAKDFWDVVASSVDGKDPSECQQKWFEHFATPKVRRRQAKTKRVSPEELGTPLAVKTPPSRILGTADYDSVVAPGQPVTAQADPDDLFQATPMRGRRRVRVEPAGSSSGPSTPKTPPGPDTLSEDGGLVLEDNQGNGQDGSKRVVSRAYVQAMSKKMRKVSANPRNIRGSKSVGRQPPVKPRRVHATTLSGGRTIRASVASSGVVNVTCAGSDDNESELSSSCGSDSDSDN